MIARGSDYIRSVWRFAKRQGIAGAAFLGVGMAAIGAYYQAGALTLAGAVISGIAGLSGAVQQSEFQDTIEAQNQALLEQAQRLAAAVTGGLSFCHAYPFNENSAANTFEWLFIHAGPDPIYEVSVRIVNLERRSNSVLELVGRPYKLGTLLPGKAHNFGAVWQGPDRVACTLHFTARNGDWTQEFRRIRVSDGWAYVNRVSRWTDKPEDRLALSEVSKNFPMKADGSIDWGDLPPIEM